MEAGMYKIVVKKNNKVLDSVFVFRPSTEAEVIKNWRQGARGVWPANELAVALAVPGKSSRPRANPGTGANWKPRDVAARIARLKKAGFTVKFGRPYKKYAGTGGTKQVDITLSHPQLGSDTNTVELWNARAQGEALTRMVSRLKSDAIIRGGIQKYARERDASEAKRARAKVAKWKGLRSNPVSQYNKAEAYFKEDAPMTDFGALPFAYGVAYKYVDGPKARDPWHPIYASNSKQHCLDDMSVRARSRGNKALGLLYRVDGGISIQIHYDSKKEEPRTNPAPRRSNGELHEKMKATLSRVGLPFLHIDCYGRQITIETKSKDTAQKWAAVLARFSKVRGMLETFAYNKVNRGTVLLPTRHKIWRVYAVMGET